MPFTVDFEPLDSGVSMTLVLVVVSTLLAVAFVLVHGGGPTKMGRTRATRTGRTPAATAAPSHSA
jgi:hypothetical protein